MRHEVTLCSRGDAFILRYMAWGAKFSGILGESRVTSDILGCP